MNIFKRKTDEQDPYQFDPTRSSVSLAVVLLLTLGLAWLYVQSKATQVNTIELLASFSSDKNGGLSSYIAPDPQDNYYLLSNDGQPVGYIIERLAWKGNYLTCQHLLALPKSGFYTNSWWKVANNFAIWDNTSKKNSPRGSLLDIIALNKGILTIIKNNTQIVNDPLQDLCYNFVPNFFSDYITSIGLSKYPDGLKFTFDFIQEQNRLKEQSCTVSYTSDEHIPAEIKELDNSGHAVLTLRVDIDMLQYYSTSHKLLYQKFIYNDPDPEKKLPYDVTELSDLDTISNLWPEIRAIQRIPQPTIGPATEI